MNAWQIYLWMQMDNFIASTAIIGVISFILFGILGVMCLVAKVMEDEDEPLIAYKKFLWLWSIPIACMFFCVLAPSSKTLASMYVIPRLAESDVIQEDIPQVYNLALHALRMKLIETLKVEEE